MTSQHIVPALHGNHDNGDKLSSRPERLSPFDRFMDFGLNHKQLLFAVFIFIASAVGHMRALRNNYVLDDYKLIVCNEFISDEQNARILLDPKYLINPYPLVCGARPLTVLSLLIDYKFWKESPFGYHLTNIILHAFNSAAVFSLVLLLLRPPGHGRNNYDTSGHLATAFFAALVFAFHPIQAEAVNIASFRADLLATAMYLISLTALIKAVRKDRPGNIFYYGASFVFFVLGLFSKETVITLAMVFPLYAAIYVRDKIQKRTVAAILSAVAAAAVFILLFWRKRFYYLLHVSIFPNIKDNVSPLSSAGAYLNTLFLSFLHYGQTLFLPTGLSIDYEINISRSLLNPEVLLALLLFGAAAAVFMIYRNRLFRFGLCFWFICYLPVSNIFPLINTVNDRYMYLPMVGFSAALSAFIFGVFKRKVVAGVTSGALIAALIAVSYGAMTLKRNLAFEDGYSLYSEAVKIAPTNIRVRYNLAVADMAGKRYGEAINNFEIVSRINPLYMKPDMLHLMGAAYNHLGDIEKAKYYYRWALKLSPRKETINSYAGILRREGNPDGAAYLYKKSVQLDPDTASLNNLGIYYAVKKQYRTAAGYFKKAIELDPKYTNAWANLIKITHDSGDTELNDETAALLKKTFLSEQPGAGNQPPR